LTNSIVAQLSASTDYYAVQTVSSVYVFNTFLCFCSAWVPSGRLGCLSVDFSAHVKDSLLYCIV